MKRLNSDVLGSLFWIAVGALFFLGAIGQNMGTLRRPDSGFLPAIVAAIITCFGVILLIQGLMKRGGLLPRIAWKRHSLVIVSIVGYTFLVELIGFPFSTFALMFVLFGMLLEGKRKWAKALLYAAVTAFAAWLVFCVGCQVPFPTPILFRG